MSDAMTEAGEDAEMESILRKSEQLRRNIRAKRQTVNIDCPHSSSPTEGTRRERRHYTSSPFLDRESNKDPSTNTEEMKKSSSTAASKSGALAQQIQEEFLTCKICLDGFTNPKSLSCLHTFCEDCIENHANSESSYKKYSDYREFTCPLCRKRTTLPPGGVKKLPDNFLVSSLTEVIDRQIPSKFPFCDICKLVNKKHREASSKCLDCNKLLCRGCVQQHQETKVTKNHNIFDVEIEKEIECKEHRDEVVRFYCESCETAICILCTFNAHKEHEVSQFSDAVQKYKATIEELLQDCQTKLITLESHMEILINCEQNVKGTVQRIKDVAIEMIADIRNREKHLIEVVHSIYGAELMTALDKKTEYQAEFDAFKGAVQLTQMILQGKDMELLLLKKEVLNKLESLSKHDIEKLPVTAFKTIRYQPGMVDMGYVLDSERPLSCRTRTIFKDRSDNKYSVTAEECFSDNCTQTTQISSTDNSTNTSIACTIDEECQTESHERTPGIAVIHPPKRLDDSEITYRSRCASQPNMDDDESWKSKTTLTYDDDLTTQRRRRRRERAKSSRSDAQGYANETTPPGIDQQPCYGSKLKAVPKMLTCEVLVEPVRASRPRIHHKM